VVRDTDSFTETASRWMQCPLDYVVDRQEHQAVGEDDAGALEMTPGDMLTAPS
jgi:hypothetical protein